MFPAEFPAADRQKYHFYNGWNIIFLISRFMLRRPCADISPLDREKAIFGVNAGFDSIGPRSPFEPALAIWLHATANAKSGSCSASPQS
jgi:hypothetical protein